MTRRIIQPLLRPILRPRRRANRADQQPNKKSLHSLDLCWGRCLRFPNQGIEAHRPAAVKEDEEKNETVNYGQFSTVNNGKEPAVRMYHKIRHRHHATGEKSGRAREQSEGNQESADQFNVPADHAEGIERHRLGRRGEAENFLSAMTGERQSDYESHNEEDYTGVAIEKVHVREAELSPLRGQD